jgi:hypothetical protein
MKYFFVYVYLFNLIIKIIRNLIVIPFDIREIKGADNNEFIYTQIEIGDPPRKIDSLINFQDSLFYFWNISSSYIDLNSSYNPSNSSSFNIISNINNSHFKNIISEDIYFYTDINCTNKSKYKISKILFPELIINQSLFNIIGMQVNNTNKTYNLINLLKSKDIIDNYIWTIKFENLTQGKLIIGDFPHNYDKNNYENKNLTLINTYSKGDKIFWGIQFSAIKFGQKTINDLNIGKIEPKFEDIIGPYEYIISIEEIFFEKYKNKDICKRIFDKLDGEDIFRYVCDKDMFEKKDIDLFPNLTLISAELNFSFVLTGKELFMEKNNKINFLIVSKFGKTDVDWKLGRIFLYKYQFVMDNDNNLIGIYKDNNKNVFEEKEKNSTMLIVILSILALNMIVILSVTNFCIWKKLCKNSKRQLSELEEEDYIYFTHKKL